MSSSQPSMLTLAAAMIDPSYAKLKKPHHEFHHAWESKTLDEDELIAGDGSNLVLSGDHGDLGVHGFWRRVRRS